MSGYSPLDLYLMGMIPKEQVPPMVLIENNTIDKTKIPQLGATITGTPKTITIEDIIAAEGARVPDAAASPKLFKVGFVLLTRPGDNATAAISATETLRTAWAGRFAELTQGKGSIADIPASLNVTIDTPADNATITRPDVTASGTIINSTGAETGVTVNGQPATISGSRFIANHVPLQEGTNTLTITATDANGLTTTTTKTVTAQAGHYIRISSNIGSGTGPLDVSFRINGSFSAATYAKSVSGPVPVIVTNGASPEEFSARMTVEGTYTFTASATAPDGQTYSDSVTVTVVNMSQLEALLKGKWEGMNSKVSQGDIVGALQYLRKGYRSYYQELFSALGSQLPQLAEGAPQLEFVYSGDDRAKCRVFQQEIVQGSPVTVGYPIFFEKEDGVWRLIQY